MRYPLNFIEYFWYRHDIEYFDIVFGNYGSKKSIPSTASFDNSISFGFCYTHCNIGNQEIILWNTEL